MIRRRSRRLSSKQRLETLANAIPDHSPAVCGDCLFLSIEMEVAKEMLKASQYNMAEFKKECQMRWKNTDLVKEMRQLRDSGIPFEDCVEKMKLKGWIAV